MNLHSRILVPLLAIAALGAVYAPAAEARAWVGISVGIAPPAPRHERVIVRRGYVRAPGYWRWAPRRHAYVWRAGYWMRERPGWRWVAPRWVPRGPRWVFRAGYWTRLGHVRP